MKKKFLSILLAVCMVLTMVPTVAWAAATTETLGAFTVTHDGRASYSNGVLTVTGDCTIANTDSNTPTTDKIVVKSVVPADITLNGVNIDLSGSDNCAFDMTGATVNLTLTGDNKLRSGSGKAGLQVPEGAELTIGATGGTVTATGGDSGAGIGGSDGGIGGTVNISGGTVTATGGDSGAGIGGGDGGIGGTVNISGGTVTATGGDIGGLVDSGAGIGGGGGGKGGTVNISGGTVIASGTDGGAGIGGGGSGKGGTVTIDGGTVIASADGGGAGIGGGSNNNDSGTLRNAGGTDVKLYTLTLSGVTSAAAVTGLTLPDGYPYGITGMKTDESGKLYLYLPAAKTGAVTVTTATGTYSGTISDDAATLLPPQSADEAKWGVVKANGTAPDTWVGSGTLTDAVSYANGLSGSKAYIQLQSDVDTTASLTFNSGKTASLDLNGKTIDGKNMSGLTKTVFQILQNANVTLTDTSDGAAENPGKITGGKDYGMAVYGDFSMLGGSITGNGNGVYAYKGSCTMLGGSVTGNTNGGVVINHSSFTVGGNAVITGNTSGTGADQIDQNVLLYQESDIITVSTDKPLESGALIGVTMRNFSQSDRVNITGANSTDYSGYFTSDSENYKILNSGTGNAQAVTLIANNLVTVSAGTNGGVAANAGTTGAITSGTTRVMAGETVTIIPTANPGYKVGTISVCQTGNPGATVAVSHNTFTMPAYAVTISVTFQAATASSPSSSSSPTVNTDKTETKVDTASNTAIVTTKPDSVNTTGNTTSIETTIPSVTVDNTRTSTNGSVVDTAKKSSVTINVPTEAIIQQLAAKKDVELTLTVPHDVARDTVGGAAITINANKEILEAAKENLSDVTIKIKDADTQQLAYSWTFKGEDLAKSAAPMTDVNIAMSVHLTTEVPKVNAITPSNKGLVLSFDHSGLLPSVASVKFSALAKGFKPGETLYFYYYNPTTKQIESLGKDAYTVGSDGYVTVQIVHCSDYVLLPKAVRTITLDTRTYTMRPKKNYQIGVKLTGISNTTIKAYSSTKGVANVTVLKNGNVKVTGAKSGLTYIMIDVYDSKNKFLTHASIKLTVQNGVKEYGNSARQYGIF